MLLSSSRTTLAGGAAAAVAACSRYHSPCAATEGTSSQLSNLSQRLTKIERNIGLDKRPAEVRLVYFQVCLFVVFDPLNSSLSTICLRMHAIEINTRRGLALKPPV